MANVKLMTLLRIAHERLKVITNKTFRKSYLGEKSYSQKGEDLIIANIFEQLKITHPTYLDIGAHHPILLSNTYYFYKKGSSGVNVEPDPYLHNKFLFSRKRDINLNIGIGVDKTDNADFYVMSARVLNTFSKEEAESVESFGTYKIKKILKIGLTPVSDIIDRYFKEKVPDFVSIDVEGLDLEICKSFNFEKHRPKVFCIETLEYNEKNEPSRNKELIQFMESHDYIIYYDTKLNTIFVDKHLKNESLV